MSVEFQGNHLFEFSSLVFNTAALLKNLSARGGYAVSHPYWRAALKTGIPVHTNREKVEKNRENDKSGDL